MADDSLGLVRFDDRPATRWRNGRGSTREVAARLLGVKGPEFVWRLSVAEVTEDVEFSTFPKVERTATLIEGDGLALDVNGIERVLRAYEPFSFDGEAETFARPTSGPVRLLNVMTKTNRMSARVRIGDLSDGKPITVAGAAVFVQLTGGCTVYAADGASAELGPLDALIPRPRVRLLVGTGRVAVVRMQNFRAYRAMA